VIAVKTASKMTYTVSGEALNSTQSNPIDLWLFCNRRWSVYDARSCWICVMHSTSKLLTRSTPCYRCCRTLSHRNRYIHVGLLLPVLH